MTSVSSSAGNVEPAVTGTDPADSPWKVLYRILGEPALASPAASAP